MALLDVREVDHDGRVLYSSMILTVFNYSWADRVPSFVSHKHGFEEVNLVDIPFTHSIKVKWTLTKFPAVVCLEAMDDASVQGLNKCRQIWLEKFYPHICWLVRDVMAQKVVNCQANMMILLTHLQVKHFDPPVDLS
jgi:hypothetical protein